MAIYFTPSLPFETSVLFLVFNRLDTTERVFEAIRQARPPRLYVAADGPREEREGEALKVARVREIATAVDWPCEVRTLFREKNLGCKSAVSGAITWFFEQEERGIILEDDCLPHPDFFTYCENLLRRYEDDERVSVITGTNFQGGMQQSNSSYYFSKYNHCWGWATWRRAWKHYQGELPFWPEWSASVVWKEHTSDKIERRYWEKICERVRAGEIDSWAYPWTFSVWYHGGLTATPNVNLISNIGFGPDATHTISKKNEFADLPVSCMGALHHPPDICRNISADRWTFDYRFNGRNLRFPRRWIILPRRVIGYIFTRFIKSLFRNLSG